MKKKVLLTSIATIALCLCLIAGSTFALFTSQDEINIAVTSAKVKMTATISDLKLESVKADPNGTVVDEFGGRYKYETYTDAFANGGTAEFDEDKNVLTLEKVTPGDRVSFNVKGTNDSNVMIQYRYIVECAGEELLMSGLNVTIDGVVYPALDSYTSAWAPLQPGQNIDPELIVIELPVTAGNEYQEKETAIKITVEAVQGNADIGQNNVPVVEFLEGSNVTSVSDLASLQAALDNAGVGSEADGIVENIIVITNDIVGNVTAIQKAYSKTIIEGNGYTFAGAFTVDGRSQKGVTTTGLTIKNVNFKDDSLSAAAYINLGNGSNNTRYTNNVTVKGCTFSYNGTADDKVAVKSYTGGDFNLTLDGCVVNAGMHSALQVKNVEKGLKIIGCEINNTIEGINLNSTLSLEMVGCTISTKSYAVRFGVDGSTTNGIFEIADSTLTSANDGGNAVIILRGDMTASTLTLTNTTLVGTPDITGTADIVKN